MKKKLQFVYLFIFMVGINNTTMGQDRDSEGINTISKSDDGSVLIDDFEKYDNGTIPYDWYNQRGDARPSTYDKKDKEEYRYSVRQENGNRFLEYEGTAARHLNFPLMNKNVNLYETPVLKWKWRIWDIPAGGNEDDKNDVAASIYVVFDLGHVLFKKVPKSIRYTWSSSLDKGTELTKLFGNQKIIVMGTGNDNEGQWQFFERNIVADYKRLFGDKPPKTPLAILILSDGDDTGNEAKADYDDIMLSPAKE